MNKMNLNKIPQSVALDSDESTLSKKQDDNLKVERHFDALPAGPLKNVYQHQILSPSGA